MFPAITNYRMAGQDYGFDDIIRVSDPDPILNFEILIAKNFQFAFIFAFHA